MLNKALTLLVLMTTSSLSFAQGQSRESLPEFLKGLKFEKQTIRHGFMRWEKRKPYSPMLNTASSKRGKLIYEKHCMGCHGSTGLGDGPNAKLLEVAPSNLKKYTKYFSNHFLAFQVEAGGDKMPMWKDVLTEEQIWDLTHYMHELSLRE